jgi:hypothetical protein
MRRVNSLPHVSQLPELFPLLTSLHPHHLLSTEKLNLCVPNLYRHLLQSVYQAYVKCLSPPVLLSPGEEVEGKRGTGHGELEGTGKMRGDNGVL